MITMRSVMEEINNNAKLNVTEQVIIITINALGDMCLYFSMLRIARLTKGQGDHFS